MKTTSIKVIIALVAGLLFPRTNQAQGTITYVSNLGQPLSGAVAVGSDSWFGANFVTGTNASGYMLNSVQLAMADASGAPGDFKVMIYSSFGVSGPFPGNNLANLTGSSDPTGAGSYAYTPGSSLQLSPNTFYFVVVTAGTQVANGAYEWNATSSPTTGYNTYHWGGELFFAQSTDGLNWGYTSSSYGLYSLDATAAPEPGIVILLTLGGLLIGVKQWNEKKRS